MAANSFRAAMVVVAFGMLAGCAQKWEKPGATEAEFKAVKAACGSAAFSQFPPMNRQVQIGAGYTTPMTTNCYGYGYSANCYTTGGQYVPPAMMTIDDNQSARDQSVTACLYQNGWQPVKSK